ncbi:MAG TPA: ATP-binding cassette domain-containing protein [Burkholderiaceae bacterium]|nr:ATP-binding cassette domain-containing protein [Burkholderiaceae bacterium]
MIDVALHHTVSDGTRHFTLAAEFASDAPVVALYGASGAGKSLTLQAMAGLIRPARGHVRVGGRTLFDSAAGVDVATRARGLGYLFQHYALFPHLNVRENIAFGLGSWWRRRLDPRGQARVEQMLDLFELRTMAASRPAALSGGQQQRVALARALACEPDALLLDEPFAALNPMLRAGLRSELATLRYRLGIPMVVITHDIDDLAALADHVFVLDEGRVVREVDLRGGTRREHALDALRPAPLPPAQALRRQILAGSLG